MKCDRCEREATVHELRVANGQKIERHLCEECAREDGIAVPGPTSVPELIEKALAPMVSSAKPKAEAPKVPAEKSCSTCGTTYSQFRQSGQLGCPQCYQAFEAELGPLLERWHEGGSHHVGKLPARALRAGVEPPSVTTKAAARTDPSTLLGDAQERAQKIQSLQRQLEEAVRAEQYERAATIRDEMRRLSGLEGQTRHSTGRGG